MNSRKKKITIYAFSALITLASGIVIGIALTMPYYQTRSTIDLAIHQAWQAYVYADNFGKDAPAKAKHRILLDLKFNLNKLQMMRHSASSRMKEHMCDQLIGMTENKDSLINFSKQLDSDPKLEVFLNNLEECRSW